MIANLALWFGLHVLFTDVGRITIMGVGPDVPNLLSLDWKPAILTLAAMIAMLRFKVGLGPTLLACAVGGLALSYLA